MNEIYKDIGGYYGDYQISNLGNVKSFKKTERLLKFGINATGYYHVGLSYNGLVKYHNVHRLVAETFIPNSNSKQCINHINGIKTDNRIENLEWCSYSENNQHSYDNKLHLPIIHSNETKNKMSVIRLGKKHTTSSIEHMSIIKQGEKNKTAKLKNVDIVEIRKLRKNGLTYKTIGDKYNVTHACIYQICKNKSWKHII